MTIYGRPPKLIGEMSIPLTEMMFYQYLPIKMPGGEIRAEPRIERAFSGLIGRCACDFVGYRGLNAFMASYMYLTCKHMFQVPGFSFNREGWHSDGFMTDDINYVWCDKDPTIYNVGEFNLTQDDVISLQEMGDQAKPENNIVFPENSILRLDESVIHRVNDITRPHMRGFAKISFSKDKYDLIGNSHNYELDYDWPMRPRSIIRNIPQSLQKGTV